MALTPRPHERLAFNIGRAAVLPHPASVGRAAVTQPTPVEAAPRAAVEPRSDWAYRGLLAFTAVLLLRPQDQIPGLGALHLAEMSALGAVGAMAIQRLNRGLPIMRLTPEAIGMLALGGAILFSVPFSIWPTGVIAVFTDAWVKMLIVFVLMVNTLTTPRRLEQITWLIVVCCGYISVCSLYDYSRGVNLVEGDRLGGPVGGIFGNPNDLAMNMVTFLPVAVVLALAPKNSGNRRLVASVIAAVMLATIVLTKSRGAMLGLASLLITLLFVGHRVRKGFAAIAVVGVLAAAPLAPSSFWARMTTILDSERDRTEFTGSREARSTVMKEGLQAFAERPLWGLGAGQFPNYDPPGRKEKWRETHNALIQVAAEMGLPGLLAYCFLIIRAAIAIASTRKMIEPPRRQGAPDPAGAVLSPQERRELQLQTVAVTAGLVGWFVCAQFASVAYNWTFYYLLALIVAGRDLTQHRLATLRRVRATA